MSRRAGLSVARNRLACLEYPPYLVADIQLLHLRDLEQVPPANFLRIRYAEDLRNVRIHKLDGSFGVRREDTHRRRTEHLLTAIALGGEHRLHLHPIGDVSPNQYHVFDRALRPTHRVRDNVRPMRTDFLRRPRVEHGAFRFTAFQCPIHEIFDSDRLIAAIRTPRHVRTRPTDHVASLATGPFEMRVVREHDASIFRLDDTDTIGNRIDDALVEEPQRLDLPFALESDRDVSNDLADADRLPSMIGEQRPRQFHVDRRTIPTKSPRTMHNRLIVGSDSINRGDRVTVTLYCVVIRAENRKRLTDNLRLRVSE